MLEVRPLQTLRGRTRDVWAAAVGIAQVVGEHSIAARWVPERAAQVGGPHVAPGQDA